VRPHLISVIAQHRAPSFVPTGQPENSPAFQRRVFVGTGTSPAGTAEWTAHGFPDCPSFHPANLGRPSGTCIDFTTNPALKCRAIVIMSLRDGQTPIAPIVHPKLNTGKERFQCGMRNAECGERPSSLLSSLRYDAASCFDAARSAEWGARPSRLPFSASRRKPFNQLI
jgi:hypothetical protein